MEGIDAEEMGSKRLGDLIFGVNGWGPGRNNYGPNHTIWKGEEPPNFLGGN